MRPSPTTPFTVWLVLSLICACSHATPPTSRTPRPAAANAAAMSSHRSAADRARDPFRHPAQTLAFFGLAPTMTVVEIWPGRGWYTAILAPILRDRGTLIAATMDPQDTSFRGRFAREYRAHIAGNPAIYDRVITRVFFGDKLEIAPEGSVDLILSFRSAHNWIRWEGHAPEAYLSAVARALKPGGVFGIVQHRAPTGTAGAESGEIGYLTEDLVVALAEAAGLQLVGRSEINANPRDSHNHPNGVWSLPPTFRGGDVDRTSFSEIGESDRMTLKFQKPEN